MPAGEQQPTIDLKSNWQRLDELAGCRDAWSAGTGNPCASDVPVIWAKKSIDWQADDEWLSAHGVENSLSTCLVYFPGGACREWLDSKGGCWREEASVCNCTAQAGSAAAPYCQEWHCIAKEVHHQSCWEADWDSAFKTECEPPGWAPWPLGTDTGLNMTEFRMVLAAEGTEEALGLGYADAELLLHVKQKKNQYKLGIHCVAQHAVRDQQKLMPLASAKPCGQGWRTIASKLFSCRCLKAGEGGGFCAEWQCAASRRLSPPETRSYKCHGLNSSCSAWSVEVAGPLAEVGECRACVNASSGCLSSCSSRTMHRVVEFPLPEDEADWGKRLGFTILHLLWLLPMACVTTQPFVWFTGQTQYSDDIRWNDLCVATCGSAVLTVACCLLAWLLAFYREMKDVEPVPPLPRVEVRAPTAPLGGLFLMFGVAGLAALVNAVNRPGKPHQTTRVLATAVIGPLTLVFLGSMWTCGLAIAWLPLLVLLCCTGSQFCH